MPRRGGKEGDLSDGSFLSSFLWLIPVSPQDVNFFVSLGVLTGRPSGSQIFHFLGMVLYMGPDVLHMVLYMGEPESSWVL